MVSLLKLAKITEEGVWFVSPHDGKETNLTPEHSMQIQNSIGSDIMMQLDDCVHVLTTGPRLGEAMERSIRWLDRCNKAHARKDKQNLFAIIQVLTFPFYYIQGGLDETLRDRCLDEMIKRDMPGYAIGGLSGGEKKEDFWRIVLQVQIDSYVFQCTKKLPKNKPRYLMGVGYPVDIAVCIALGVDMFDCVWPTRYFIVRIKFLEPLVLVLHCVEQRLVDYLT